MTSPAFAPTLRTTADDTKSAVAMNERQRLPELALPTVQPQLGEATGTTGAAVERKHGRYEKEAAERGGRRQCAPRRHPASLPTRTPSFSLPRPLRVPSSLSLAPSSTTTAETTLFFL